MYPQSTDIAFIENRARQLRADATRAFFRSLFAKRRASSTRTVTA